MIKLEAITKIYPNPKLGRSIVALSGCDLAVEESSFVSIIGPSGAGKSTLLRILSGLEQPTSGKVNVLSQDIDLLTPKKLYQFRLQNIGFLNQMPHYNLFPELSVEQNLLIPLRLLGESREKGKKVVEDALERMEIKHLSQHRAKQLSMGESMRVSLAVALITNPPILLADEPTGQLDKKNTQVILELLKAINQQEGTTILVVSHDPVYFSVVSESFLIFNGRLGAVYTQEDLNEHLLEGEQEKENQTKEIFVSHIDSFSYLFLPNRIKELLALDKKVKFVIDYEIKKVFLENPQGSEAFKEVEHPQFVKISGFHPKKHKKGVTPILACRNLQKWYHSPNDQLILDGINLQLLPSELVFLIGPSGSGKTTFLNILSGMDLDFNGSLELFGKVISSSNQSLVEKVRAQKMYYLSQYVNLYPSMTLDENLNYFLNVHKTQKERAFYEKDFLLHFLTLDEITYQDVAKFSLGERKRASFLLGLLQAPEILLLDEPTANLDEMNKHKVMSLLVDYIMGTGASAIVVTHDLLSLIPNSRVIMLENGKIARERIATKEFCTKIKDQFLSKKRIGF
ncbi:MAG: ATP-binding cassette domain-containing protein [Candidatus Heimdallarchaeota archaeon]|nr:ATP-binding cassette domain-containing protein [Candidatus Heimdallarchaeota archaeon]